MGRPLMICGINIVITDMGWCRVGTHAIRGGGIRERLMTACRAASLAGTAAARSVSQSVAKISAAGQGFASALEGIRRVVTGDAPPAAARLMTLAGVPIVLTPMAWSLIVVPLEG